MRILLFLSLFFLSMAQAQTQDPQLRNSVSLGEPDTVSVEVDRVVLGKVSEKHQWIGVETGSSIPVLVNRKAKGFPAMKRKIEDLKGAKKKIVLRLRLITEKGRDGFYEIEEIN